MSEKDKNKDEQGFSGDENLSNDKAGNESNFGTPENYFDSFTSRLFSKIKANDELKEYPLLSGLEKVNPFAVPAGYFEAREELLEFAMLRDPDSYREKQKNFIVPANYFETFPLIVANKISVGEEMKEYTELASFSKENVFAVPANYFEEFAGSVKELLTPAKVIPLYVQVVKKYKFAVAAAVALFLTLTIVLLNQTTTVENTTECTTVACLSKKEIINSGVIQNMSEESIIEMINIEALSDSLSIRQNGKKEKIGADEVSDEIDVNTLTEEL